MTDDPEFTATGDGPRSVEPYRALPLADLIDRYAAATTVIERRVLDLDDEQADTHFRPEAGVGRWSCRVLLGHLADAEAVFCHRMRRTVAEERPVLAVWDEDAFIDAGLYGAERGAPPRLAGFVAVIHTVRVWTAEWLRTLGEPAFDGRLALHPERGELSLRDQLDTAVWHLDHHAWFLSAKLERLLGPSEG